MLSLEHIAAVKTAVEICNSSALKRTILFAPDGVNKRKNREWKELWGETVEKIAISTIKNVPSKLKKKIIDVVLAIGMRMLTWALYHERTLRLSREYSLSFLNSSFFTQQGIIDSKKVAVKLINDKNLIIEQKYKAACLYCFTDHITAFFKQMTKEVKEQLYSTRRQWINQPELVRYWSYYLIGEVDKIKGEKTLDQYRLEKAVESGSQYAVEHFLCETNLRGANDAIIDAAVEAVANKIINQDGNVETWVRSDYCVDIVHFLLSNMTEGQQIEFLKKDIEGTKYTTEHLEYRRRSRVLEFFLNWPYQYYFMETAELMWEFLPENNYAVLLLKICDRIEPEKQKNLKLGGIKSYNYRGLLKEFWCQSPERFKRYILRNPEIRYRTDKVEAGVALLSKVLKLDNFTNQDVKNLGVILATAEDKEKENIISSKEWRNICIELIKEEKWVILDRFANFCFSSTQQANKFKKELILTNEAKKICINFIKNYKLDAAESAMKWSSLSEEEVNKLKKEMIYSAEGKHACRDLYNEDVEATNHIFMWCFASEEEVREFKKELIFSNIGMARVESLVLYNNLELADKFISWCLFSQEKIEEFKKEIKKTIAHRIGSSLCERLISDFALKRFYDDQGCYRTIEHNPIFKGGKWEEVEKFLTWCFSSEKEIIDFKKNVLLVRSGVEIHFNLTKSNQWKEAETFFSWLGLSAEDIKELKKETLFDYGVASQMFHVLELMCYSEEIGEELVDDESKQATELLLRWYLTDKETVLQFKDEFRRQHRQCHIVTEKHEAIFTKLDELIQGCLSEKKQKGLKRKKL